MGALILIYSRQNCLRNFGEKGEARHLSCSLSLQTVDVRRCFDVVEMRGTFACATYPINSRWLLFTLREICKQIFSICKSPYYYQIKKHPCGCFFIWWRCGDLHPGLERFIKTFYILILFLVFVSVMVKGNL